MEKHLVDVPVIKYEDVTHPLKCAICVALDGGFTEVYIDSAKKSDHERESVAASGRDVRDAFVG